MPLYADLTKLELKKLKNDLDKEYRAFHNNNLKLNMARGKPGADQLDLSMDMLNILAGYTDCLAEDGTDCRNYGVLDGIPEAKELMASLLDDDPENVIVGGNSSLTLMYDSLARYLDFGALGSKPWADFDTIKWICPSPGYDRHFSITGAFGITMLPVPMTEEGPDMDLVESIASSDECVKGIWCVPKYSNPSGVTYSKEVVERLARMECAASDFRIFWDNAYSVHHLFDDPLKQDQLFDIGTACKEAGNPDRYLKFASTSKITFPGSGISAMATSADALNDIRSHLGVCTIGYDKLNQLRHVKFLKNAEGISEHMSKHASLLRPKFELVEKKLSDGLGHTGLATWSKPKGGYFVSFNAYEGTAKRIVGLMKKAGVVMTGAGATWPYKQDPKDSNIRIAPTMPPVEELDTALDVFICCVKLAAVEKLIAQ